MLFLYTTTLLCSDSLLASSKTKNKHKISPKIFSVNYGYRTTGSGIYNHWNPIFSKCAVTLQSWRRPRDIGRRATTFDRQIAEQNYLSHLEETAPQSTSVEHEIYAKELLSLMDTTIASLPPQKRTIFNMSRKEGLSNDEIALRLNLKKNTVEKTISSVLTQLKKNMLAALLFLIP